MEREEVKKLLMMMQTLWPTYRPPDKTAAVEMWWVLFKGIDYQMAEQALARYALTNTPYAPSPGQLLEAMKPQSLTEAEAWGMVVRAVRNSTYHSVEEFAKLPDAVKRAVGDPTILAGWAMLPDESMEVAHASFKKEYARALAMPESLHKTPEKLAQENRIRELVGRTAALLSVNEEYVSADEWRQRQ